MCLEQLRQIGAALKRYRTAAKKLPPRLATLYPRYINDRRVFDCPLAIRAVGTRGTQTRPAHMSSTYVYWYQSILRASRTPQAKREPGVPHYTWAQLYKQRGEKLPVVMCQLHDPYLRRNSAARGDHPYVMLVLRLDGSVERSALRPREQPDRKIDWFEF